MEQALVFLALCIAMFMGSYLCGYTPIYITSKTSHISAVSVFGAGLMIGVSLLIIIPEGVHALYRASYSKVKYSDNDFQFGSIETSLSNYAETHQLIGIYLIAGFLSMLIIEQTLKLYEDYSRKSDPEEPLLLPLSGAENPSHHHHRHEHSPLRSQGLGDSELFRKQKISYSTKVILIGIILHCFADGFAFGTCGYSMILLLLLLFI